MNKFLQEYLQTLENLWYEFSETAEDWTFNILKDSKFLWIAEILWNNKVIFKLKEENYEFQKEMTNYSFKWKLFIVDTKTFEVLF